MTVATSLVGHLESSFTSLILILICSLEYSQYITVTYMQVGPSCGDFSLTRDACK